MSFALVVDVEGMMKSKRQFCGIMDTKAYQYITHMCISSSFHPHFQSEALPILLVSQMLIALDQIIWWEPLAKNSITIEFPLTVSQRKCPMKCA